MVEYVGAAVASRMFQYERTQSRIGEDLWSAREKYLANSPLFFADKSHTPLLILHNDQMVVLCLGIRGLNYLLRFEG